MFAFAESSCMKSYQTKKLISLYICTDSLIVVQCYITVCGLMEASLQNEMDVNKRANK